MKRQITPEDFYLLALSSNYHSLARQVAVKASKVIDASPPVTPEVKAAEPPPPPVAAPPTPALPPRPPASIDEPELDVSQIKEELIFADTETTGIHQPFVLQLAYYHIKGGVVEEYCEVLKLPSGVRIDPVAQRVHGITLEMTHNGADPTVELTKFLDVCERVLASGGKVVFHNSSFDCRAINQTADKLGMGRRLDVDKTLCTMKTSAQHSPLKTVNGRRKAFRLEELYSHLHGVPPAWAKLHDAAADTRVLVHSFVAASRLGWW